METSRSTLVTRHKAVDAYNRLGSLKGVAKEVNKSVSYVKRCVARHEQGMGMGELPRAGRPSFALNNDDAIDTITACMLDRQGPTRMGSRLKAELRFEVSPETVRRFVK
jgi:transposase